MQWRSGMLLEHVAVAETATLVDAAVAALPALEDRPPGIASGRAPGPATPSGRSAVPALERVLWVRPTGVDVVTIRIDWPWVFPEWWSAEELEAALAAGALRLTTNDPFARLRKPDHLLDARRIARRAQAWALLRPLAEGHGPELYHRDTFRLAARAYAQRMGVPERRIVNLMRTYWQRGQCEAALTPDYDPCGAPGRQRQPRGPRQKLGRPSADERLLGERKGVNLDACYAEGKTFRSAIWDAVAVFHVGEGHDLTKAYQLMKENQLHRSVTLEGGEVVKVVPPPDACPTERQFDFEAEKFLRENYLEYLLARHGERAYNLKYRPMPGGDVALPPGPGFIYQLDWTLADIYLVSKWDRRRIIGRPVLYLVVDVFSRAIVGLYIRLDKPGWWHAALALENAILPKAAFCARFGHDIDEERDWPARGVPEQIVGDRGEVRSKQADSAVRKLGIRIALAAPYRADWKAFVERTFKLLDDEVVEWLPGALYEARDRGDPDYRRDAVLNLDEFHKIIIALIRMYNRTHLIKDYPPDPQMMADRVVPTPNNLWHWGMENRMGGLHEVPEDVLRLNLLPPAKAAITPRGLVYDRRRYVTEQIDLRPRMARARRKRETVTVLTDPGRTGILYLIDKGMVVPCRLHPEEAFLDGHPQDLQDHYAMAQRAARQVNQAREQEEMDFHRLVEDTVARAEADRVTTEASLGKLANAEALDIKRNRRLDREREQGVGEAGPPAGGEPLADAPAGGKRATTPPSRPRQAPKHRVPTPFDATLRLLNDGGRDG